MKIRFLLATLSLIIVIPILYFFGNKVRRGWSKLAIWILGIKVKLVGTIDESATCYIFNHQSLLDIVAFEAISTKNSCWVAKKELFDMFYFGHLMRAPKMICVDREDKKGLFSLIADAKDRIEHNRPIAIFPEGTRSKDKQMLPFKPGAKVVVEKLKLKVQPFIIVDSANFIDTKNRKIPLLSNGELKIIALDSFEIHENWYSEIQTKMQTILDEQRIAL